MAWPIRPAPTMPTRSLLSFVMCDLSLSLCLRLQHGVEWLRRIGKLGRIDWHALLDQPARRTHLALRVDAEHVGDDSAVKLEEDRGVVAELAANALTWLGDRPAHALDVHVVLLRPVRRQHRIGHAAAGGVAAGD